MIIKALVKYQHTVVDPDALFVMVKDAGHNNTVSKNCSVESIQANLIRVLPSLNTSRLIL